MATEYKLSYTGAEIDEKLGKIESLSEQVGQLSSEEVVLYTAQTLTDAQKAQARENIGAAKDSSSSLDEDKLRSFATLFNGSGENESFVFFADPHLLEVNTLTAMQSNMQSYLGCMKEYYEATPTSFVLCAGDWIGNGDTKEQACFKLGLLDSFMRKNFQPYYPVLGNHDTNYQGVDDSGTVGTGTLTNETIRNLMFRENENTYYSFKGQNTTFYVFESGSDWKPDMNDFRWEQVDWFANKLLEDDAPHSAIAIHIFSESTYVTATFASNVLAVAQAYNNKTMLTLNGVDYDFTAATGRVEFLLAGHTHDDNVLMVNGIQVVVTTNMRDGSTPTFDLCLADYTSRKLYLERVGTGNSRRIVYLDEDKVDIETDEDTGSGDTGNYDSRILLLGMNRTGNMLFPNDTHRAVYVSTTTTTGLKAFKQYDGYDYSYWDNYYPIEIPNGAKQIIVTCPTSVKWALLSGYGIDSIDGYDSGWQSVGGGALPIVDGHTCCMIVFHDNLYDTTAVGYDTSAYSLTFSADSYVEPEEPVEPDAPVIFLPTIGWSNNTILSFPARMVAVTDVQTGGIPAYTNGNGVTDTYYALPKPEGATSITMTCPSNMHWAYNAIYNSNDSARAYYDSGWLEAGGGTLELSEEVQTNTTQFMLVFKQSPEANFATDYDTSGISWEWGFD